MDTLTATCARAEAFAAAVVAIPACMDLIDMNFIAVPIAWATSPIKEPTGAYAKNVMAPARSMVSNNNLDHKRT